MDEPIRVMIERGKKKNVVAVAFDWPGWDRSAKTEEGALQVHTRTIVGHVNITDLRENSKKVGVRSPEDTWKDPVALRAHRDAIVAGIRAFNAIGPAAGRWWT